LSFYSFCHYKTAHFHPQSLLLFFYVAYAVPQKLYLKLQFLQIRIKIVLFSCFDHLEQRTFAESTVGGETRLLAAIFAEGLSETCEHSGVAVGPRG